MVYAYVFMFILFEIIVDLVKVFKKISCQCG